MAWLVQASFATGEIDPSMVARTDLAKMGMAALTLRNRTVLPHGPTEVRPGFAFIHAAKFNDKVAVLRPFAYSLGQNYVMEVGDRYIRFYMENGIILGAGSAIYEVATPFAAEHLFDLNFTQSADRMYITHRAYPTQVLTRTGHASWTCVPFEFSGGPFLPDNLTDLTVHCSGTTGSGKVLTASSALFASGHVGALWKITHDIPGQFLTGKFTAAGVSSVIRGKGDWRVKTHGLWTAKLQLERSIDGSTWEAYASYSGDEDNNVIDQEPSDGLYSYRLNCVEYTAGTDKELSYELQMTAHEWTGIVKVTAVTDPTHAVVTVIDELAATSAVKTWAEGAWSDKWGHPSCSLFFQNRLGFAGAPSQPESVCFSKTDSYGDFKLGTDDDDAITLPLVSRQSNPINAMVARKHVVAFTSASEFILDTNNGAMTPTSPPMATEQESNGIGMVDPLAVAGGRTVFVAPQGNVVLDIGYNLTDDAYSAKQLSIMAPHLFRNRRIVDAAYQKAPESICWFVRDDGVLLGLTYLRDQEIWAWHRHDTEGKFLSVCSIRGLERNELWALVERTVSGIPRRYVERLAPSVPTTDPADQFYLDSGLSYSGSPVNLVQNLGHLEGRTVSVNADGFTEKGFVVTGGQITLPQAASKIHVGLPYVADLVIPDADFPSQEGTVQGRSKRLDRVILRVQNARGGKTGLSLSDEVTAMDLIPPQLQTTFGVPIPLYDGDIECSVPSDVDTTARVCLRQTEPMPLTVLAVVRQVSLCD